MEDRNAAFFEMLLPKRLGLQPLSHMGLSRFAIPIIRQNYPPWLFETLVVESTLSEEKANWVKEGF